MWYQSLNSTQKSKKSTHWKVHLTARSSWETIFSNKCLILALDLQKTWMEVITLGSSNQLSPPSASAAECILHLSFLPQQHQKLSKIYSFLFESNQQQEFGRAKITKNPQPEPNSPAYLSHPDALYFKSSLFSAAKKFKQPNRGIDKDDVIHTEETLQTISRKPTVSTSDLEKELSDMRKLYEEEKKENATLTKKLEETNKRIDETNKQIPHL
jgi:hypothetical protein